MMAKGLTFVLMHYNTYTLVLLVFTCNVQQEQLDLWLLPTAHTVHGTGTHITDLLDVNHLSKLHSV